MKINACTYVRNVRVCMYVRMFVCMYVCMYVCTYAITEKKKEGQMNRHKKYTAVVLHKTKNCKK